MSGVNFDRQSAKRIISGVRLIEGQHAGPHSPPAKNPRRPRNAISTIRLAVVTEAAAMPDNWNDGTDCQIGKARIIARERKPSGVFEYKETSEIIEFFNDDPDETIGVGRQLKVVREPSGFYSIVWMLCDA